jgi:hypothetical protein
MPESPPDLLKVDGFAYCSVGRSGMKDGIVVDVETWPVVRFELRGKMTDEDWLGIFTSYDRLYERRERFAVLSDSTHLESVPGANVRKEITALTRAHEENTKRYVVHGAIVVPNPVARGALTALNWLSPPVYKQTYHSVCIEALDAILVSLEASGAPTGPTVFAYRERLLRSSA